MGRLMFHEIYRPLTSRPFLSNPSYAEHRPCALLRPYVACYWTAGGKGNRSGDGAQRDGVLVIPDTCMDIIIRVDQARQTVGGYLCGIQDQPFVTESGGPGEAGDCFAIRFPFWSAGLFLDLDFMDTRNRRVGLGALGRDWERLFEPFPFLTGVGERIARVEAFLLRRLDGRDGSPHLLNAIHRILSTSGRASVKEVCEYGSVGQRQMERVFLRETGLTMKKASNLVRYQNVWRDMVAGGRFDIQDAVYRYGYTDQAHLLHEFKRYHGVTPEKAGEIARLNR